MTDGGSGSDPEVRNQASDVKLYRATKSLSAVIHISTHTHQLIHFYISICFFFKNNLTHQMVCYMEPSGNCFQGLSIKLGRWLDKPTSTNQMDSRRAAPSLEPLHKIQSLQCRSLLFFRWNKFSSADRTDATAAATLTSGGAAEQSNTWTTPVTAAVPQRGWLKQSLKSGEMDLHDLKYPAAC